MYDLTSYTMADMARLGSVLRKLGDGAQSMEESAGRIVRLLFDELGSTDEPKSRALALARLYKTHDYGKLDPELREFGQKLMVGQRIVPTTKCLTLLATAGDRPEWNARQASKGHKSIPLPSEEVVAQIPMIAQLIQQFGLEISTILRPTEDFLLDAEQRSYNVFHVPLALGSPFIPAQEDFVVPERIQSVLSFGGVFPTGDLFAVILFSRVPIPRETAQMFRTAAPSVKLSLLPFVRRVFVQ